MEPFARDLVEQARKAFDATPADRARVRGKLAARIGPGAPGHGGAARAMRLAGRTWITKVAGSVVLVGALGGYAWVHRTLPADRPAAPAAPATNVVVTGPEAIVATPPAAPDQGVGEVPAAAASGKGSPGRAAAAPSHGPKQPAAPGDLEAEMALIADAQAAIQRADYSTALAKLDEHQRTFPDGVLGEERTAARVVALCGAGRAAEARSLSNAFLARHPTSPLAPRVKSACANR